VQVDWCIPFDAQVFAVLKLRVELDSWMFFALQAMAEGLLEERMGLSLHIFVTHHSNSCFTKFLMYPYVMV